MTATLVEEQRVDRLVDDAQCLQRAVDDAVASEQHSPGVYPNNRVQLVEHDQPEQQRDLESSGLERHHVGERHADHAAE